MLPADVNPLISVIISNYDATCLTDIADLIDSLQFQTYGNLEIVLVTEVSELCGRIYSYISRSRQESVRCLVVPAGIGASAARNFGIRNAKGDLYAFVDDDVVLSKIWAQEIVNTFRLSESIIGTVGSVRPKWQDQDLSWLPAELEWLVSCTGWLNKEGVYPIHGHTWTSNACFKKEAFKNGLLFSEALGPRLGIPGWRRANISEDVELSMRIQVSSGGVVVYNSAIKAWKKIDRSKLSIERIISCSIGIGKSRSSKQRLFQSEMTSDLMSLEKDLLRRILLQVIPRTIAESNNLRTFFRVLLTIVTVLVSFCIGYAEGKFTQTSR